MEDTNKIDKQEELLDKIKEEIDILESIFDGEGIVITQPYVTEASDQ